MGAVLPGNGWKWKWSLGLLNSRVITLAGLVLLIRACCTIGRTETHRALLVTEAA
jgi:hypothetical protein